MLSRRPWSVQEYDIATADITTLKVTPVPNYDASLYRTRRIDVTARDGALVPLTLLWRPDAAPEGTPAPCHLCMPPRGSLQP